MRRERNTRGGPPALGAPFDPESIAPYVDLALAGVQREYPNQIAHVLQSDEDARPPRELTPAFYGAYDWHSAVHGHWTLARAARLGRGAPYAAWARQALGLSLTEHNVTGELFYLSGPGREGFERPYGLAWLLQLCAELREWGTGAAAPGLNEEAEDAAAAARWARTLAPLEALVVERLGTWLPKLPFAVRSGEHSQTAFALGLMLDWARVAGDNEFEKLCVKSARRFYLADRDAPLRYEPSGEDFLSPALGEADLMRRVLVPGEYAEWLSGFLPGIPRDGGAQWLTPVRSPDPADGKLSHLDGLNLSRAWMLIGIAAGLPADDARAPALRAAADAHARVGLSAVSGKHYAGAHWLGTFATYLLTGRGLGA